MDDGAPDPKEYVDPVALADLVCNRLVPAETALRDLAQGTAAMAERGSRGLFGNPELERTLDEFTATMAARTAVLAADLTRLVDTVRDKVVEHSDIAAGAAAELARAAPSAPPSTTPELSPDDGTEATP